MGTPVFIVVRCIAANRAAGTVYELINQSINQSNQSIRTPPVLGQVVTSTISNAYYIVTSTI